MRVSGDGLLALKAGWTNWEVFAEENQVVGWNDTLNVCEWTGVYCLNSSGIGRVFWMCGPRLGKPSLSHLYALSLFCVVSQASKLHDDRTFRQLAARIGLHPRRSSLSWKHS